MVEGGGTVKVRRIDFSPTEWLEGTTELDCATRGLYITACALMWARGGPIDRELLRATCRDHGHAFKRQFGLLIQKGKLIVNDGQITNKRAINELQNAEERSVNGAQNAAKRWKNKELQGGSPLLDGNANHQPSTIIPERRGSGRRKPRRPISPDWTPDGEDLVHAWEKAGWHGERATAEGERFRNWHLKDGTLFADVKAGWRMWVQNGARYEGEKKHVGPDGYEILAQAARDFDERENGGSDPQAFARSAWNSEKLGNGGATIHPLPVRSAPQAIGESGVARDPMESLFPEAGGSSVVHPR